eukprot:3538864-Amphidinium_carterae.1
MDQEIGGLSTTIGNGGLRGGAIYQKHCKKCFKKACNAVLWDAGSSILEVVVRHKTKSCKCHLHLSHDLCY